MQKDVKFQIEEAIEIPKWADAYPEHKFTVFKCCFLSTKPNSHELDISADVLRRNAKTILGNFLVAKVEFGDATTHRNSEIIYGYFPIEQEIEFVEDGDILKAYAYAVVSKKYSKEFNGIFEFDNMRNSSVEMSVETPDGDEHTVESFDIYGLTCLGKSINGSCPDADIQMVRFAQEEAEDYYHKGTTVITALQKFVQEREKSMAATYKIDKSKEAMSTKAWSEIDKEDLRNKIMEADNKAELVKACYMLVEDGWEDAPSQYLKYPVMNFEGDTLVYNRNGLAAALGRARQQNETSVIDKVEKIYKDLDLDDSEGKEEKKMSEIENTPAEEMTETVEEVKEETAEPIQEEAHEAEPSVEELLAKLTELQGCIDERDNIIMGKDEEIAKRDAELEELRKFKADTEAKEQAMAVEKIMSEVTKFMDKDSISKFREEGLKVEFAQLDAWSNKVKASVVDKVTKQDKSDGIFGFSAPVQAAPKSNNVWERIKNN